MKRASRKYKSPIRRLTVNQVAAAMLRGGKKTWMSLAIGVFLSLFLISAMVLSVQGVMLAKKEQVAQKMGYENCLLIDYPEMTDAQLRESGQFDRIGHVTVSARLAEGERYLGWYDDTAASLMNRRVMEGRMPEAAGEIAVDQSMLEYLRTDAQVGDEIALDLVPVDGLQEARAYTLVGILADQNLDISNWLRGGLRVTCFPSMIVTAKENGFATGRLAVHRVMTLARGVSLASVMRGNWEKYDDYMFCIDERGNLVHWYDGYSRVEGLLNITTLLVILLGLSLVLSAGVGVAQAMEGQLARRVEEIGMLRAVGATRRQIRRVFGRQTWLIALILAPFSIGMGCAFAWALSRLLPDTVVFRPTPGLIAPMAILSMLCIWLSSSLPLRRASRIMPMSVIRDTALLRKAKHVKGREAFRPARLLARRQMRLYPTRQLGAAAMAALMLFCAAIGVLGAAQSLWENWTDADFMIYNEDYSWAQPTFSDIDMADRFLTDGDLNQLRALPRVKNIVTRRQMNVTLLMNEPTDYLTLTNEYLAGEEAAWTWMAWDEELSARKERAPLIQNLLGTDKTLAEMQLIVVSMTQETADVLNGMVAEGRVDLDALDAGGQVLVYAPTVYQLESEGGAAHVTESDLNRGHRGWTVAHRWENDVFHAGDALNIVQLIGKAASGEDMFDIHSGWEETPEQFMSWLDACERRDASVTIGAVLEDTSGYGNQYGLDLGSECCLLTTEKGMRALGLYPKSIYYVSMYLDGAVDDETGEYLSGRIKAIAARANNAYVYDAVAAERRNREEIAQTILAFSAMAFLFFAVTVGLVSGNASRRIRADQRMIGTLRAVGADERVLLKCYGAQIGVGLAAGLIAALAIVLAVMLGLMKNVPAGTMALSLGAMVALAALCLFFCTIALRMSLRETMKKSIVENIREL